MYIQLCPFNATFLLSGGGEGGLASSDLTESAISVPRIDLVSLEFDVALVIIIVHGQPGLCTNTVEVIIWVGVWYQ